MTRTKTKKTRTHSQTPYRAPRFIRQIFNFNYSKLTTCHFHSTLTHRLLCVALERKVAERIFVARFTELPPSNPRKLRWQCKCLLEIHAVHRFVLIYGDYVHKRFAHFRLLFFIRDAFVFSIIGKIR